MQIETFKSILPKYKAIFFDAFGVLKTYNGLLPGIENTFKYLKEQGQDYYIVTSLVTVLLLYIGSAKTSLFEI